MLKARRSPLLQSYKLKPSHLSLPPIGVFTATLGHAETEAVAAVIVRWHHVHSNEKWEDIRLGDLTAWMRDDEIIKDWSNPLWLTTFLHGVQEFECLNEGFGKGWVQGDTDSRLILLPPFFNALSGSVWDSREKGA